MLPGPGARGGRGRPCCRPCSHALGGGELSCYGPDRAVPWLPAATGKPRRWDPWGPFLRHTNAALGNTDPRDAAPVAGTVLTTRSKTAFPHPVF